MIIPEACTKSMILRSARPKSCKLSLGKVSEAGGADVTLRQLSLMKRCRSLDIRL
jgi:hypothetical protein